MPQRKTQLIISARRLCQQCEDLRARAERVMQHSEDLHRNHAIRRQNQKKRKTQRVR